MGIIHNECVTNSQFSIRILQMLSKIEQETAPLIGRAVTYAPLLAPHIPKNVKQKKVKLMEKLKSNEDITRLGIRRRVEQVREVMGEGSNSSGQSSNPFPDEGQPEAGGLD